MELNTVRIDKPTDLNFILGQSHFIKTVEDLYEAIVQTVPGMKFGIGFCESSGPALVRYAGNDGRLIELAQRNALSLSCGHCFIIFMEGGFPVNIFLTVSRTYRRSAISSALQPIRWRLWWVRPSRAAAFWGSSTASRRRASKPKRTSRRGRNFCGRLVTNCSAQRSRTCFVGLRLLPGFRLLLQGAL